MERRIDEITEQLKTDSLNYELIWSRLILKLYLLDCNTTLAQTYSYYAEPICDCEKINCENLEKDFKKIYDNVIEVKNFDLIEEGHFYMERLRFYTLTSQLKKAYQDAYYLKDHASYSRYADRGEFYNNFALNHIFNLHLLRGDYDKALEAINIILKKEKKGEPDIYYGVNNHSYVKIQLFEAYGRKKEIIQYLKQLCWESFVWYSYKSSNLSEPEWWRDQEEYLFYMEGAKKNGLNYLKQLVSYMKKYNCQELSKFEKLYNRIRYRVTEKHETINANFTED